MAPSRPDTHERLRRVLTEPNRGKRGKLTIFLGAAPGVGKTYAMLEVARVEMEQQKRNVVVGIVETHGRYETGAQLLGLELLPRRKVLYHGVQIEELDLDAALRRRPQLLLVDELAHTNAEGSRHPQRWQDVDELLDAGIDVFSTMNVQHVESLSDVVAKITGVHVRETVPDSVLEQAHELKLVDLPPDELLERLRDGKVYLGAEAPRALDNFFKKGSLIALRELALRHTAERVDAQMRDYRETEGVEATWAVNDQLLVAVSASPHSARLVRAARRMAASLRARWFAVYVEPRGSVAPSKAAAERLSQNLQLAEQLGAHVVRLAGDSATEEILRFARARNITKLIIGKPLPGRLWERLRPSVVDQIVRQSGDIDVYVTAGDPDFSDDRSRTGSVLEPLHGSRCAVAAMAPLLATAVSLLVFGRDQLPDVVMIYLLGIMLVSSKLAFGPSTFAAFLSVAAFDFFFVPPYLTFAVEDLRHATTFIVMLVVAVVISGLTQRIRNQAVAAQERELRTAALYGLSRELAAAQGLDNVVLAAAGQLQSAFESAVTVWMPDVSAVLSRRYAPATLGKGSERELSICQWVWANQREAGRGTTTHPGGDTLYLPLMGSTGIVGVLGIMPATPESLRQPSQRLQLDAFVSQMALAVERAKLAEEAEVARREMETEQLKNSLLSSVSHDLRTPLAVITGASSTLLQAGPAIDDATREDLLRTVLEEAERLNRLIRNLLDMTRLESGEVKVHKEWLSLEELVGSALSHLDSRLCAREVQVELPQDLPLVPGDAVLLEQILINLLENAIKYSSGAIEIRAQAMPGEVMVEVGDRGAGIQAGEKECIFDKFHRSERVGGREGVGLGLTICRAIATAHGGGIRASNRQGGGASFRFTLPLVGTPAQLPPTETETETDPTRESPR